MGMARSTEYKDRFAQAMRLDGRDPDSTSHIVKLAEELNVSRQAITKVLAGFTKMMAADNNVKAARLMKVDSEWLATGEGEARGARTWPLSHELLQAARTADAKALFRAENAARSALDLETLRRPGLGESSTQTSSRKPAKTGTA